MEAKRFLTIFLEDCAVLGVDFDPALGFGLHLIAISSRFLPRELRPVLQLLPFVYYCIFYCPLGAHR